MTQEMESTQTIYECKVLEKRWHDIMSARLQDEFLKQMNVQNDITDYLNHLSSKEVRNAPGILSCGQRYERENNKEEEN